MARTALLEPDDNPHGRPPPECQNKHQHHKELRRVGACGTMIAKYGERMSF